MKLVVNVAKKEPANIEEVVMEDVNCFVMNDNEVRVIFNQGGEEVIKLRDNDGQGIGDWIGANIFATRKFLQVDMSK